MGRKRKDESGYGSNQKFQKVELSGAQQVHMILPWEDLGPVKRWVMQENCSVSA